MRKLGVVLALVGAVSLLCTSDVLAGAAGAPAGKTTGTSQVATIVIDVTGGAFNPGKGLTSIRLQRSGTNVAALFTSPTIFTWSDKKQCKEALADILGFNGLLNGWVDQGVLSALFGGLANQAAIIDTDYAICTTVDGLGAFPVGKRQVLSFTAVIQFVK